MSQLSDDEVLSVTLPARHLIVMLLLGVAVELPMLDLLLLHRFMRLPQVPFLVTAFLWVLLAGLTVGLVRTALGLGKPIVLFDVSHDGLSPRVDRLDRRRAMPVIPWSAISHMALESLRSDESITRVVAVYLKPGQEAPAEVSIIPKPADSVRYFPAYGNPGGKELLDRLELLRRSGGG